MANNDRNHIRIRVDASVFIEVQAADETSPAMLEKCEVLDVSYGGFRARIATEVPQGALLSVCVELPAVEEPFFMVGEVMWCRPDDDANGGWLLGFKLLKSSDTDIDAWRDLLENV